MKNLSGTYRFDGSALTGSFAFCQYEGTLHNSKDLRNRFHSPSASEADLARRLMEAEGLDGLRHLIGDWSLALVNPSARTVVLASDYAARRLYYEYSRGSVRWASSLSAFANADPASLDESYLIGFLTLSGDPNRTPYRGVAAVPPGTAIEITDAGIRLHRFWNLPAGRRTRFTHYDEYEECFRDLFREAVAVRLDDDRTVSAELSGGLDSSSIVCMANHLVSTGAVPCKRLAAVTYTVESSPDLPFANAVAKFCGIKPTRIDINENSVFDPHQPNGVRPEWWTPRWNAVQEWMCREQSSTLLTGRLGDLVTGNWLDDSEQVADLIAEGELRHAFRDLFLWSRSLRLPVYSVLSNVLRTGLNSGDGFRSREFTFNREDRQFGDSFTPETRKRVRTEAVAAKQNACRVEKAPVRRKHLGMLRAALDSGLLQQPEGVEQIRLSHPFSHRPLVEFLLTIPPSILCGPGEPRRLMRKSLRGLVPSSVLDRRSKAAYDLPVYQCLRPVAKEMLVNIRALTLVQRGIIEPTSLQMRLQRFTAGLSCNESQLRQILLLECWLRSSQRERAATGAASLS